MLGELIDLWQMERELHESGCEYVCGVDEAGRGPLAGPVFAAAVIFPPGLTIPYLNDSKKLSDRMRRELAPLIRYNAIAWGIGEASVREIEEINISNASYLAMNRAISQLYPAPELLLVDGNRFGGCEIPWQCVVGGDGKCAGIAAASILAKVARDDFMIRLAERYPEYGFERHKGYGTRLHYERLREYGASPVHRMSFLRRFFEHPDSGSGGYG